MLYHQLLAQHGYDEWNHEGSHTLDSLMLVQVISTCTCMELANPLLHSHNEYILELKRRHAVLE
jgi:hypothetical protein